MGCASKLRRHPPHGRKQMNAVVIKSAVALALTAALSWSAHADRLNGAVTVTSAPTMTVSFAELDITKPRGLEVLYSRIEHAAKVVCGVDPSPQPLSRTRHAKTCYKTAVDDAVRQINRPTLTALHRTKTRSAFG
jgi:UrcA family protein